MSTAAATVSGPWLLQAQANAVSATANTKAPWVMPCPFTMSGRIVMVAVAAPALTSCTSIPSARDAASPASIRVTASVTDPPMRARRCAGGCSDGYFGSLDGRDRIGVAREGDARGGPPAAEVKHHLRRRTADGGHVAGAIPPP